MISYRNSFLVRTVTPHYSVSDRGKYTVAPSDDMKTFKAFSIVEGCLLIRTHMDFIMGRKKEPGVTVTKHSDMSSATATDEITDLERHSEMHSQKVIFK